MNADIPVYECRKVPNGSITIDGDLSDWRGIPTVGEFTVSDGSGPAVRRTLARICWDDNNLYISFDSDDPDIWGTLFNRDEPIYEEEVVEAFIDPDSDLVRYYEFQASPHGTLFDAIIDNPTGLRRDIGVNTAWDCEGWQVGLRIDGTLDNRKDFDKGWTAEWAIPFKSLETAPNTPPKDGDTWRINLYRIDRTPTAEYSCWSPTLETPANFHVPPRFGRIVFRE